METGGVIGRRKVKLGIALCNLLKSSNIVALRQKGNSNVEND